MRKINILLISFSILVILLLAFVFFYPKGEYKSNTKENNNEEVNLPLIKYGVPVDVESVIVEENYLKIKTESHSYCVYSNINCSYSFLEGTQMPYGNTQYHGAEWFPDKTYYIKCSKNETGMINDCSKVVSCKGYENLTGCIK